MEIAEDWLLLAHELLGFERWPMALFGAIGLCLARLDWKERAAPVPHLLVALATAAALSCSEPDAPRDVFLLTLDTARADLLGSYGGPGRTPHLDALAADSVRFEQAITTAPYTGPSHASLLTGQVPPRHGLRDYLEQVLPQGARTLAEILSREGYRTAAFVSSYVLDARFGLDQGFDLYSSPQPRPGSGEARRVERPARETADLALAWLAARERARPFFLWVHFYDAHHPYRTPPRYRQPLPPDRDPESADAQRQRYYEQAGLLDDEAARLLAALREDRAWDRCVVVVVADHGEPLGEQGTRLSAHSRYLLDSTLRVPLLLRVPGRLRAGVETRQVSVVDVLPTVLDALGIAPGPGESLDGRSLLGAADAAPAPAYSETFYADYPARAPEGRELRSLRVEGWKLLSGPHGDALYDLAGSGEPVDVASEQPGKLAELRRLLDEERTRWGAPPAPVPVDRPPDEEREHQERLRALGYVE